MYGFTDEHLVARAPNVEIWRAEKVILVRIHGVLDDAGSDRWRAMVTDEVAKRGTPRFIALDFSRCDPQNSMAARYRSAAFARDMMKRIEHGLVLTGGTAGPTVVVRAVLRALGLPNLDLLVDAEELAQGIAAMRRGFRPRRVSSRAG